MLLEELLNPMNITQRALAKEIGVTFARMNELIVNADVRAEHFRRKARGFPRTDTPDMAHS
jgi:plasmid maintenance system antidote protein VapI